MGIELNNKQLYGIYEMENWWTKRNKQLFEISGAAGTGKTLLVRFLIEKLGLCWDEVLFVAYMGKAAMQLARNGLPAKTVHSAIYQLEKRVLRDLDGNMIFKDNGRPKMEYRFIKKDIISKKIKLIVLDEGSTVNEIMGKDLMSFGIPMIILGDLNQLPPVFGKPFFLTEPDIILTEIMRQAENSPIIWLSQQVLANKPLAPGIYGNSQVLYKSDISEYMFRDSEIVLTSTNNLRYNINTMYREEIYNFSKLDLLNVGEKIICRKNNYNKSIGDDIFLMNGLTGYVDYVDMETYTGKKVNIDFRPDFIANKKFKNITIDYPHLFKNPKLKLDDEPFGNRFLDKFEFAYAITTHSSQGSQWDNVFLMAENMGFSKEDHKKLIYTGITRAIDRIRIAI